MRFNNPLARTAFAAVARNFGEAVRIEPRINGTYSDDSPDPSRPLKDLRAVVSLTPMTGSLDGSRQGSKINTTTRFTQRTTTIWVTPDAYASIGYDIRVGDRVILKERRNEPPYRVGRDAEISDRGDISINLVVDGDR